MEGPDDERRHRKIITSLKSDKKRNSEGKRWQSIWTIRKGKKAWIALLAKRPLSDEDGTMSEWLMDVLAVSDNRMKKAKSKAKESPEQSRMLLKRR